jgi:hypothetical protein
VVRASAHRRRRWYGSLIARQANGSGFTHMGNRYCDPTNGRFTQEDPLRLAGGSSSTGSPTGILNYSDPFELCPIPHPVAEAVCAVAVRASVFWLTRGAPAVAAAGAASTGLSAPAARVAGGVGAGARATGYVYRGLAAADNTAVGLVARAPGAGNTPISHVAGQRASQWISTTKSPEIAEQLFGQHGVAGSTWAR